MPRTIDYYFTLASPWAFLGHRPFVDLAKAHGVTIRYRPVDLGEVFPHTGGLPLPKRHPARQRYRILELQRWREARGIALKIQPKHWPFPARPRTAPSWRSPRAAPIPAATPSAPSRASG